ncbi:MAG: hypothetical protein ACI8U1_000543, partial [Rheinheimera aquimaris]
TTIINSIKVKPCWLRFILTSPDFLLAARAAYNFELFNKRRKSNVTKFAC